LETTFKQVRLLPLNYSILDRRTSHAGSRTGKKQLKLACTPSFFSNLAMDFDRVPLASIIMTFESPYKSRRKTQ
jgi:hypothetical protein